MARWHTPELKSHLELRSLLVRGKYLCIDDRKASFSCNSRDLIFNRVIIHSNIFYSNIFYSNFIDSDFIAIANLPCANIRQRHAISLPNTAPVPHSRGFRG